MFRWFRWFEFRFDYIRVLWLDIWSFVKCHKYKFLFAFAFAVLGAALAIASAVRVQDITRISIARFNLILLIMGQRNFFVYFIFNCLPFLIIIALISIFGFKPIFSYLSFVTITFFCYQIVHQLTIILRFAALTVLPLAIFSIIPLFILTLFSLSFYVVFMIEFSVKYRVLRWGDIPCYFRTLFRPLATVTIVGIVLILLEALITMLFAGAIII